MTELSGKGKITREAILESARQAFAQSGYSVSLREIAGNAGLITMVVKRYFGSKEQVFREVVDIVLPILAQELEVAADLRTLCHNIAVALISESVSHATPMDGMLIMLRSMNSEVAAAILCKGFETHCAGALLKLLPGPDAAQQTAVFLSGVASFQAMHLINGKMMVTRSDSDAIAERLVSLFRLLTNDAT